MFRPRLAVLVGALIVAGLGVAPSALAGVVAPTVTKLAPTSSPTSGGTVVTVTGTNLSGATAVAFGTTKGTHVVVSSSSSLTVTAPAHPAGTGTVDVRVTTPGGTSAVVAADHFAFIAAPSIRAISPATGTTAADTRVVVTGSNFYSVVSVLFGGAAGTGLTVTSSTRLTIMAPAHAAGAVGVQVRTAYGSSAAVAADRYIYSPYTPRALPEPADAGSGPGLAGLTETVCTSATTCLSVGSYQDNAGQNQALIETYSGGSWTASVPPLPAGGTRTGSSGLEAVSCASFISCVAVGQYTAATGEAHGLIETLAGGSWSAVTVPVPAADAGVTVNSDLLTVSCPAPTSCVAGAEFITIEGIPTAYFAARSGSTWTAVDAPPFPVDSASAPQAISCVAVGSCVAVSWYNQGPDPLYHSVIETLSGGSWHAITAPTAPGAAASYLPAIRCTAPGTCIAVGEGTAPASDTGDPGPQFPIAVKLTNGAWTATRLPLPGGGTGPNAALSALACSSASTCTAVGNYYVPYSGANGPTAYSLPLTEVYTNGTWTAASPALPSDAAVPSAMAQGPGALLTDVSCPAAGSCAAVGAYQTVATSTRPLIETLSSGAWADTGAPTPSASSTAPAALHTVACSATTCAATGTYAATSNNTRLFAETRR